MEDILASIRRIISDEDVPEPAAAGGGSDADAAIEPETADMAAQTDMAADMSQDDLDKLFDSDGGGFDVDETDFEAEAAEEAEPDVEAEVEAEADAVLELTEDFAVEDEGEDDIAFATDEVAADNAFEAAAADEAFEEEVEVAAAPAAPTPEPAMPRSDYKPIPDDIEAVADKDPLISSLAGSAIQSAFADLTHTVLSNNAKTLDDLVREMLRPMLKAWLDQNLPTLVERMVRQEIERVSRGR